MSDKRAQEASLSLLPGTYRQPLEAPANEVQQSPSVG